MTESTSHWGNTYRDGTTRAANDLYESFRWAAAHEIGESRLRQIVNGTVSQWPAGLTLADIEQAERQIQAQIDATLNEIAADLWVDGIA